MKLGLGTSIPWPAAKRDVFLDPDQSPETVVREFARLKKLARQNGFALGIGHPYPSTLAFLEQELPKLRTEGFELISISELVALANVTHNSGHTVAAQATLLDANNKEASLTHGAERQSATECLHFVRADDARAVRSALRAQILNGEARSRAWIAADKQLSGTVSFLTPEDEMKSRCSFDPDALEN